MSASVFSSSSYANCKGPNFFLWLRHGSSLQFAPGATAPALFLQLQA